MKRRHFLKNTSLFTAGALSAPAILHAQNKGDKIKIAVIGAGGRGAAGMGAAMNEELVAIADVDFNRVGKNLDKAKEKFPGMKAYRDYRELFDKHSDLDAVWVATPDHNHFPASVRALSAGVAVYCEKPLTHELWEARKLAQLAAEKKVATQMGNQGHSSEDIRLIVEYIRGGTLGDVQKVHCVSNRSFGAKGERPASKPAPEGLDWEAWLGPAPFREFHDGLHPFNWRGYLDFGTGSIGDMGCHTIDGAVWALKLGEADSVEVVAEKGGVNKEGFNGHARIVYRFPARGDLPPVELTWWNGGSKDDLPPRPEALEEGRDLLSQGTYYYGSKGVMMSGSHCQGVRLIPESFQKETGKPEKMIERVPGHTGDFFRAVKDSSAPAPSSNFGYATKLTEIVLLGTIALRVGEGAKLSYDLKAGKFTGSNADAANALVRREPRKGWEFGYEMA
ncbi:MAG: Gfo/Idh/MocA family oxidoreductase [Verrucomicrobiales bacterium]